MKQIYLPPWLVQNSPQVTLILKAQTCIEASPHCKMELTILSLLIVAWGNYAFVCNYQFSIAFHCLQNCSSDGDVTGMFNFLPLKTDKSSNDSF